MRQSKMAQRVWPKQWVIEQTAAIVCHPLTDNRDKLRGLQLLARLQGYIVSESKSALTVTHTSALSQLSVQELRELANGFRQQLALESGTVVEGALVSDSSSEPSI